LPVQPHVTLNLQTVSGTHLLSHADFAGTKFCKLA